MTRVRGAAALLVVVLFARAAMAQTATADDLFDDSVLHDIHLVVHPRDWASLKANFLLDDYYPAHFVWRGQTLRNVAIRSRGMGSRHPAKPGLRVDFDRYDATQTLGGLTSVVLRNNAQDPTSMHEWLSMKLFTRMGIPAPRTAHARLFVNGEYAGLYLIVESIDRRFLARHFPDTDGYLYKYEWVAPYYFEDRGADPRQYSPIPFTPETHVTDPDPRPLVDMIRAINGTDVAAIDARVDLSAFVRQAAVENFVAEVDGLIGYAGLNNFYLYRHRSSGRSTFIPWDKSEAFKGGVEWSILTHISDRSAGERNRLMDRVLSNPELFDLYLATLLECVGNVSDGWLEREVRRGYDLIAQWALDDQVKPFSDIDFENGVQELLDFMQRRSAFVISDVRRSR